MRQVLVVFVLFVSLAGAVERDRVLFLARFHQDLAPEVARGGGVVASAAVEVNTDSGRFGPGLDLARSGAFVSYPAAGNIDLDQGTLLLWLRPVNWPAGKHCYARVFALGFDPAHRDRLEFLPGSMHLSKAEKSQTLLFCNFRNWNDFNLETEITAWPAGEWRHIALTWKVNGNRQLFVDGVLMGEKPYVRAQQQPGEIIFGSPRAGIGGKCSIDEVCILDYVLEPAAIRGAFLSVPGDAPPLFLARQDFTAMPVVPAPQDASLYTGEEPIDAFFTAVPISLDGALDDPAWSGAVPVPPLRTPKDAEPQAASEIKILYDQKYLYVGCLFQEPEMGKLRADLDQHDLPIYNNDCLEVVLDTAGTAEATYHFVVNSIGGIYDSRNADQAAFNANNAIAVGKRHDSAWTLEFALPYADLLIKPPQPGESWGIRVCRERYPVPEISSYPVCPAPPYGARSFLTRLNFQGNAGADASLAATILTRHFQPGVNVIEIQLQNRGEAARQLEVSALVVTADGPLPPPVKTALELEAGRMQAVTLAISVTSSVATQIAVEVAEQGAIVWRHGIKAGFTAPPMDPVRFSRQLSRLDSDLCLWDSIHAPTASALRKNVVAVRRVLDEYAEALRGALAARATLSAEACDQLAAGINGFQHWLEERRMVAWEVSPWDNGSPADLPPPSAPAAALRFRQAGNEWEFKALAITGVLPGGGRDYRLATADLYDDKGTRINRSNITVYQAPFVRNSAGQLVTDPLIENEADAFTLLPGTARRFWIAVQARDMAPGTYWTELTVKPLDVKSSPREQWLVIPVEVEVLPITLPPTHEWPVDALLWHGGLTPSQDEIPTLDFLHRHHFNWFSTDRFRYDYGKPANGGLRVPPPPGTPAPAPGRDYFVPENISANDALLHRALEKKMKVLFAWNICRDPEWVKLMTDHLRQLGFSTDHYLFSGMADEFRASFLEKGLAFHRAAYAAAPETRWMCTMTTVPPPEGCTEEQFDQVVEFIKNPILFNSHLWPREQERSGKMQAWLRRHPDLHPWIYRCSTSMQTRPLISYYRLAPLNSRLCGVRGIAYWVLTSVNGKKVTRRGREVWCVPDGHFDLSDPDIRSMDGMLYWHPRKNVIPTKRFMALVKGLEDYALLDLLHQRHPGHPLVSDAVLLEMHQQETLEAIHEWREKVIDALCTPTNP